MIAWAGLIWFLFCWSCVDLLHVTDAFAEPTPNAVFQMQKSNLNRPWLHIATDSGTITRRVKSIDRSGLYELTTSDGVAQPGPLVWNDIRRIDEVVTRSKQMRRYGSVILGLTAAGLGNAIGAPGGHGGRYAALGFTVGFMAGGAVGSHLGDRYPTSERAWYVAEAIARSDSAVAAAQIIPPDSSRLDTAGAGATTGATAADQPADGGERTSDAVLRACERIDRDELLRVHSRLGIFEGYAEVSGPEGLESLRAHHTLAGASAPPTLIPWEAIDQVEVRGGSVLRGAVGGGILFGALGALLGTAAVSLAESGVSAGEGAALGVVYVAPLGVVLGGLGGMAARRWVVLYRRP